MKQFIKKSLVAAAAVVGLGTGAFGASGQTDVDFNFPNIVILHYIDKVTFDVPASAFGSDSINEGDAGVITPTLSGTDTLTLDAAMGITISQALNGYKGIIQNAWAVRGLVGSGGIDVSITLDTADATNGTSKVTISNAIVDDGTNSGTLINFASPGLSAANAHYGDVKFDIDFTNVTVPGTHSGAQYTVTAVAH